MESKQPEQNEQNEKLSMDQIRYLVSNINKNDKYEKRHLYYNVSKYFNLNLIFATDMQHGFGMDGNAPLPWNFRKDLKYFSDTTKASECGGYNIIVMGRNTWESLPEHVRPLPKRLCIILSTSLEQDNDLVIDQRADQETSKRQLNNMSDKLIDYLQTGLFCKSLDDLMKILNKLKLYNKKFQKYNDNEPYFKLSNNVFFIGGTSILGNEQLMPHINRVFWTKIFEKYNCDITLDFLNKLLSNFVLDHVTTISDNDGSKEDNTTLEFREYVRNNMKHQEHQYLQILREILTEGEQRSDRTGTGIISTFGKIERYDLRRGFPLLTTKKTFIRGVIEEILWMLKGQTDAKQLDEKGVKIWNHNTSREFLDSLGLDYEEGDGGPIYGFNMRHFGADYVDCHTDYDGQGFDQIEYVLDRIRNKPTDRRILFCLWNPAQLDKVCLPACHTLYQFYVSGENMEYLSCQMYQRSADMGLGVPFNIASSALLTHIFAHMTGKIPKELIHVIGDAHIYMDHVELLIRQMKRNPYPFPKLHITNTGQESVEDFDISQFNIEGYESHPGIKMKMS